ncbi:leucine-rich repeat-containing protein 16A [Elysia marginata]|uniref:Leucine-rich repeat-containing protein 16A n=1 Tax=Elysia marginata TaxID=1093978 RepID=A0AAV4JNQ0_9GAST|nr:leucine-rich repeat-containing protein 16A [Elysia marginata]
MSTRSASKIPRDVQDGIRDVMDKRVKVSLKLLVKMETKGDKTENKVLAFSPCRVFVLNARVPSKLEHSFHFLDIQSIESKKPHQLALTVDGKTFTFLALETDTEEMDHIITHIGISLKQIFPSFPLERLIAKVDVQPSERLKVMHDLIRTLDSKTPGPCGGYTTMYQCMCDYHGMPLREEVEWDVDTIYLSLDSREFRLQDFDHLLARDLVPIIGALEHNAWFKALDASNVKLLLYNCLAQPNAITYLDVSSTDCALDTLCDPLLRGCPSLTTLRASGTTFTHKRSRDVQVPLSWKQFFSSSCCLELVDLSSCRLPPEALKELLLGITANRNVKGVYVDVSSNELGPTGATVIAPCISVLSGVRGLDISNNGFDVELKTLLPELAKNHKIKQLALGRNFASIKQKFRADVMSALTVLLQEENSGLESLSLADSKLKEETAYIINALGSNETLVEIDLSGNSIGDLGARMLAKALMINNKLQQVVWDKNNISAQGFEDVAEALQKNLALKKMPYPVNDAAAALRMYPERTEIALQKIEACLQRNHSPRRFAPDQAYRLQQGFLISSTQQMVDRLVVKVEDIVNALRKTSSAEAHAQEVESALKLVADANNSRQLLPSLQEIALKSQAAGNPVDTQLQVMADSLTKAIQQQLETTTEEMLSCTSNHCPAIMADDTFHKTILEGCQNKSALPKDFITGVLETASTDIYNTTSEMNLAVAALISDNVTDGVIDSLSARHKSLTTHLNIRKSGLFKEDEREEAVMERLSLPVEKCFLPSMEFSIFGNSPKLANKRKSVLNRKTRPQSTMGEDSIHNIPRAPGAENHVVSKMKQSSAASSRSGSSEQLVELPDLPTLETTSRPLEHVTKARPKRAKAHRPTRPVINTGITEMEDGVDNILDSPAPVPPTSPSPKAPDRKEHKTKKEESPSGSKSKQEEASSGKPDNKRWMPSFMKKKEDKPKKEEDKLKKEAKEPKKSSSFSLFRKRGSEDRKRPSLSSDESPAASQNEAKNEADTSNSSSTHAVEGKKPVNTAIDVIKETPEAGPEVAITVTSEDDAAAATTSSNKSPRPVAPRRMIPPERPAVLPSKIRMSGADKSPETHKATEGEETASTDDQKEGAGMEEAKDSTSSPHQEKGQNGEEGEIGEQRRLPPGLAKMPGLGALGGKNLLHEIELKQKKRFSPKPVSPGEVSVATIRREMCVSF